MFDFIFDHLWGWIGLTGVIVAGCVAVMIMFPRFRGVALTIASAALAATSIYAKGQSDRAAEEKRKRDAAVDRARADYQKIDDRPDSVKSTTDKLKKGRF